MILPSRLNSVLFGLCLVVVSAGERFALAAPASDAILPATSVLYISAVDPTDLEAKFNKTQIGQLAQDETMKAFVEQLEDQINRKFGDIKDRLGVTLDELRAAAGGELTSALIYRGDEKAAFALTMNVANHRPQLEELLKKIDTHLLAEKAKKSSETVAGCELTIYVIPPQGDRGERTAVFQAGGRLPGESQCLPRNASSLPSRSQTTCARCAVVCGSFQIRLGNEID